MRMMLRVAVGVRRGFDHAGKPERAARYIYLAIRMNKSKNCIFSVKYAGQAKTFRTLISDKNGVFFILGICIICILHTSKI